ncbi:hypothetical protein [Ciceribacter sp. RN22]|uniref:hypothetical protein n=1 Tax=Ciceribacter sp. RN22 TaxID=2954932 RepID=UPI0020928BF9|nr:hypothetical protein [Ciceribacter sp. RN22]MCO6179431.1 hypothetical protein [Ciceribacter sp. RN22]
MNPVKILDVTLRDGGYRNNFGFTQDFAVSAVRALSEAGIPFIEVGYWNGPFVRKPGLGLTSRVDGAYLDTLSEAAGGRTNLCVMVHPRNVDDEDFAEIVRHDVEMIRVCLRDDQLEEGLATISLAKKHGFMVSANITRATELPLSTIALIATLSERAGADLICIADSNGSMIPADVQRIFARLTSTVGTPLGFHAHNNLSLALSNAAAAIDAGVEYIDVAISGMGKGAGNLHLAMLIAYLERVGRRHDYDLVKAMQLSAYAAEAVAQNSAPVPLVDIMLGAYNFSFDIRQKLSAQAGTEQALFSAMHALHESERKRPRPPARTGSPEGHAFMPSREMLAAVGHSLQS